ncbi:translocation and assembly module lipoprotein TamL [Dyadobacter pollutisoli]|jgi:outer membrane protein assembly factor BamA|uniref:BamA/TamA family outer membrane protein n=1 Tax=Dyadobacter pollutisoli TaxID=2910158 RepID=A0A9E8N6P1_9BACT|nr:BamA/TamA family outer membrane protein [Dyadobacter pollutisoli]WAC10343.1 BamA/TamA family outer membrane protein [Dyadobacter pollutisoli]
MKNSVFGIMVIGILLSSCSVNKYVPEGQSLYIGNNVKVTADSISKPNVSGVADQLEGIIKPPPNKTIFGFAWKVWFYYWIGEPKDEGGLRSWFRKKLGEPPKYATQRIVDINAKNMVSFLDNEGYYRSSARGKLVPSKKKKRRTAVAEYEAYVMPRYVINEISYVVPDSSLFNRDLVFSKKDTYLKKGDPIRLDVITAERTRIDSELKGKGYYYFNPDYLIVKVDSTIGKADSTLGPQQVNLFLEVKKETAQTSLKQYFINRIYVNTGTEENKSADTVVNQGRLRRGLTIKDPGNLYKRRIFYDAIGFRRGNMYTNTMHDVSLQRLVNLQNFRFVKNRFDLVPRSDSAMLDVHYDLAPMKKKSLQTTISASTKSNNLGGSQLDVTWRNRNFFRGAEMLSVRGYFGFDVQLGGNKAANPNKVGNEYYRYGASADLAFPRFIIPFVRIRPEKSQALPKTILSLNYENRIQKNLYTITSIRGDWSYVWRKNSEVEHTLTPFSINLVQSRNVNTELLAEIVTDPNTNPIDIDRLYKLVDQKYFIAGSNYSISYRPIPKPFSRNQYALTGGIDYGGNLLSLFAKRASDDTLGIYAKEFLHVPVFQYVKLDGDVRYYRTITPGIKWASRLMLGAVKPYGNSKNMTTPQFKQYFGGGSTGIRAFRARALGPGALAPDTASIRLLGYQNFADIRMEFNTELRLKFTNIINGAVFMDAGNIWSFGDGARAGYFDKNALISSKFLKQIAVGGGIGLRLDFSYLIFRLDLATPFRKPWYTQVVDTETPEGEVTYKNPWVFNEINFGSKAWRKENLILNIAVGLPF